jgi:hypothetical protein
VLYKHVRDSSVVVDHRRVGLRIALPDHSSLAQSRGAKILYLYCNRGVWDCEGLVPPCRGAW